jgi:hypothetical protein
MALNVEEVTEREKVHAVAKTSWAKVEYTDELVDELMSLCRSVSIQHEGKRPFQSGRLAIHENAQSIIDNAIAHKWKRDNFMLCLQRWNSHSMAIKRRDAQAIIDAVRESDLFTSLCKY